MFYINSPCTYIKTHYRRRTRLLNLNYGTQGLSLFYISIPSRRELPFSTVVNKGGGVGIGEAEGERESAWVLVAWTGRWCFLAALPSFDLGSGQKEQG